MRRGILIGALGTLAISAAPAGAAEQRAALAAKFTPTKAGTASAPNPVATELTFSFPDASETNVPPRGRQLDIALPEGFRYTGSGAAVCDFAKLQADGPSACPAGSQLGEGGASFYLVFPNFPVSGSTDTMKVFNTGPNQLAYYFEGSKPIHFAFSGKATIRTGDAGYGPVLGLDINQFDSNDGSYVVIRSIRTSFGGSSPSGPGSKPKPKPHDKKRAACEKRAKKIKDPKRRRAALRKCRKKHSSKKSKSRATTPPAAFAAGSCSSGTWKLAARWYYRDSEGSADAQTEVACSGTGTGAGGSGGGPTCLPVLNMCPSSRVWRWRRR